MNKKKLLKIALPLLLIMGICVSSIIYVCDYYHSSAEVEQYTNGKHCDSVSVLVSDDRMVFTPDNPEAGVIFYPGGKVEYSAYAPLLESLAEEGVMCILLKMPFNLAVFDINAADGITEEYPEVTKWYISGHSLGGAMASEYIAKNADKFEGIILLGAYSAKDISAENLEALLLYGSNDQVLNRKKFEKNKTNLPRKFAIVEIEGGCHAFFGNYGVQNGDGTATITREEQQKYARDEIIKFIFKRNS